MLFDFDEAARVRLLLPHRIQFLGNCIEFDVRSRSVQRYLFASVLQIHLSGIQTRARGTNVTDLGHAEKHRLDGRVPDGGQVAGKTDFGKCRKSRAKRQGGNERVAGLSQRCLCLGDVGLGEFDGATVLRCEVNQCGQRNLSGQKGRRDCERHSNEDAREASRTGHARIGSGLHLVIPDQYFASSAGL